MTNLSSKEIELAIERLREEYDHYIVHFERSATVKHRFEERYQLAVAQRANLTMFVGAELAAVRQLIEKAEKVQHEPTPHKRPLVRTRRSFADRLIEELRSRIQRYPALGLPAYDQLSPDVDHLFGALLWYKEQVWPVLYRVLTQNDADKQWYRLDDELNTLTPWKTRQPKWIEDYLRVLDQRADNSAIAGAQNRCLLAGATFLGKLLRALQGAQERGKTGLWNSGPTMAADLDALKRSVAFCEQVLADFRLKDLSATV